MIYDMIMHHSFNYLVYNMCPLIGNYFQWTPKTGYDIFNVAATASILVCKGLASTSLYSWNLRELVFPLLGGGLDGHIEVVPPSHEGPSMGTN